MVLILISPGGPTAGYTKPSPGKNELELVLGLPFDVFELVRFQLLSTERKRQPLAIGVILHATCHLTYARPYLAAFSAGAESRPAR